MVNRNEYNSFGAAFRAAIRAHRQSGKPVIMYNLNRQKFYAGILVLA